MSSDAALCEIQHEVDASRRLKSMISSPIALFDLYGCSFSAPKVALEQEFKLQLEFPIEQQNIYSARKFDPPYRRTSNKVTQQISVGQFRVLNAEILVTGTRRVCRIVLFIILVLPDCLNQVQISDACNGQVSVFAMVATFAGFMFITCGDCENSIVLKRARETCLAPPSNHHSISHVS